MWNTTEIDLGDIKEKELQVCEFVYEGEAEILKNISCSCGCSAPHIKDNKVIINYTPNSVPIQTIRDGKGYVQSNRTCTITLRDSEGNISKQVLKIKCNIYPRK